MLKNLKKVIEILTLKSTLGLLMISIVISLMEVLSVFSVYPLFFYIENNGIIENIYYENLINYINEIFSFNLFQSIVFVSAVVVVFTNLMVYFRYISKNQIKERVLKNNRQYVLNLISETTLLNFSKINSNTIQSYLTIESERISQIILSFTNMISALIVIFLIAVYLIYIDLLLFSYLLLIGFFLLIVLRKSYVESKNLGNNLSLINENYIKYIDKVLNDKVIFMLSDRSFIQKSFDVDVVRRLHQNRFDIQKYSSYIEFVIKTVTMISILLMMYFFYVTNTEISLILFSGVLFVRLIPFLSQFGNALQNFKSNLPLVENLEYLEEKLTKSNFVDLNEIKLKNITISLSNLKLKNIKFTKGQIDLKPGNIYGLFGESGSGKTTLAQSILGLNNFQEAKIMLNNNYVLSFKKQLITLRNSAFLSQSNIPNEFYIHELFKGFDIFLVDSLLKRFKLLNSNKVDFFKRKLSSFSGGEQQKLNFIYTILQEKKVIIFDEPTSSMDDSTLNLIMEILENYVIEQRAIIILISHSQIIKDRVSKAIILE